MAKIQKLTPPPTDAPAEGETISQIIGSLSNKIPSWDCPANLTAKIPVHETYVSSSGGVDTPISREQWIEQLKQMNTWLYCLESLCTRALAQELDLNRYVAPTIKLTTSHKNEDAATAEAVLRTIIPFSDVFNNFSSPDIEWPCKNQLTCAVKAALDVISFEMAPNITSSIKNTLERWIENNPSFSQITVLNAAQTIRFTHQALSSYNVTSKLPEEYKNSIEFLRAKNDNLTNALRSEMRNYGQTLLFMHRMGKFDELAFSAAYCALTSATYNLMGAQKEQIRTIANAMINSGYYAGYNVSYPTIADFIESIHKAKIRDWDAPW